MYPTNQVGFDKIYARIVITDAKESFFSEYSIQSLKEKNAIMVRPQKMSDLMEKLRTLVNNDYDGQFKLTQKKNEEGEKQAYLEVQGTTKQDAGNIYRNLVKIAPVFDAHPQELDKK